MLKEIDDPVVGKIVGWQSMSSGPPEAGLRKEECGLLETAYLDDRKGIPSLIKEALSRLLVPR